jgi:uncharacterized membrane protein
LRLSHGGGTPYVMQTKEPGSLLVIAFDSALKSREAFLAFQRLQQEHVLLVRDAVFIEKDHAGKVRVIETLDPEPGATAAGGGFWGALVGTLVAGPIGTLVGAAATAGLGALAAKLIDIGIPDATVAELEEATPPGSSALALLLSSVNEDALERELARFSGSKLVRSDLSPMTVQRLRNALAETEVRSSV